MESVEERVVSVLVDQLRLPSAAISPNTTFESLGIDSLVIVELSLILSDDLKVDIGNGVLSGEMTISQAAQAISELGAV
jgi:acyl carrier protein